MNSTPSPIAVTLQDARRAVLTTRSSLQALSPRDRLALAAVSNQCERLLAEIEEAMIDAGDPELCALAGETWAGGASVLRYLQGLLDGVDPDGAERRHEISLAGL